MMPVTPDAARALASEPMDERLRAALTPFAAGGAPPAAVAPRGRILRLRMGFNPNSSSVGTTVIVFLWSLIGASAVLAASAGLLAYRFARTDAPPPGGDGKDGVAPGAPAAPATPGTAAS